jgi:ABC-type Fe3+/spermidine/putrescine transport system ATPase subunit
MSFLELASVAKSFGGPQVLENLDLSIEEGEIVALLGPSGSGKTTLLRLLAGFEALDQGRIRMDGIDVSALVPARRGVGMVFQHYALFPHMRVGENVAFGLHGRGLTAEETARRVGSVLELVDLEGFEARRVSEISGGQQQRVALARALAPEPRLLLLDEPLSNLDPDLRERTRRRLRMTLQKVGITTVLVTHEQDEAFELGDRVAVLHGGRLEQVGSPEDLYRRPETRFVAGFIGRASEIAGQTVDADTVRVGNDAGGGEVLWKVAPVVAIEAGQSVVVMVRPESLALAPAESSGALPGRVVERRFSGVVTYCQVELNQGGQLEVLAENEPGEGQVGVVLRTDVLAARCFPAIGSEAGGEA